MESCWGPKPCTESGRCQRVGVHTDMSRKWSLFKVPRDKAQLVEMQNDRYHSGGRNRCSWVFTRGASDSGWSVGLGQVSGEKMVKLLLSKISLQEC